MLRVGLLPVLLVAVSGLCDAGGKARVVPIWGALIDPDGDCQFKDGPNRLVISVPGGRHDLDPRPDFKLNGPRVLQEVDGDFVAEVRVAGTLVPDKDTVLPGRKQSFRAGALLIWQSDKSFLRLDRAGMMKDGRPVPFAYFHVYRDGKLVSEQGPGLEDQPVKLCIERKGDKFIASAHQGMTVRKMPVVTWKTPAKLQVGVGAVNVSTQELHAVFEDLKITSPEK